MKTIFKVILICSLSLFGQHALATGNQNGWNNSYQKYSNKNHLKQKQNNHHFKWSNKGSWNNKNSWQSTNNGKGWKNGHNGGGHGGWYGGKKAHAVPELDTNVAPLAGLLLSGLLAAGFERRRRKQLKTLEN